jgi:hypothetical protein
LNYASEDNKLIFFLYQDARAARVTSENKNIKGTGNIPRMPRKVEFVKPNEKKTVTAGLNFH